MWNDSFGRTNVLVWVPEPLLEAGVLATLQDAGHFHVTASRQPSWDDGAHVVVTDWSSGLLFARRDESGVPSVPPHSKILTICPYAREHSIEQALRNGIHGLVRGSCSPAELVEAVKTLALGSVYVCPDVAQRMADNFSRDKLTARESEVLRLLARGQCNKTIARHLGIAVGTVKTHVKGIMAKLEASSRTEAASIATEKGMVDVPEFRSRRAAWSPVSLLNIRVLGKSESYAAA